MARQPPQHPPRMPQRRIENFVLHSNARVALMAKYKIILYYKNSKTRAFLPYALRSRLRTQTQFINGHLFLIDESTIAHCPLFSTALNVAFSSAETRIM